MFLSPKYTGKDSGSTEKEMPVAASDRSLSGSAGRYQQIKKGPNKDYTQGQEECGEDSEIERNGRR
jgi:hypothetical protein